MSQTAFPERRRHPRFKLNISVEVHAQLAQNVSDTPIHCTTSDISLGGCYIESMYPFPVGTHLELKLQLEAQFEDTLLIFARVVTCDPQFGNGIEFVRMLPEDRQELSDFLDTQLRDDAAARKMSSTH